MAGRLSIDSMQEEIFEEVTENVDISLHSAKAGDTEEQHRM